MTVTLFNMTIPTTLDKLQSDVLTKILSLVPVKDLPQTCLTNSQFHRACSTETFYMHKVKSEYPTVTKSNTLTFEHFYKMLKRFETNKAKMFEIPVEMFSWTDMEGRDIEEYEDIDKLNQDALDHIKKKFSVRRGDLIHLECESEYRNDGKFIFDGNNFIQLDFEPDDYGTVPSQFKILDDTLAFSPIFWIGVICHNSYVHFDAGPYVDQLIKNLKQTAPVFSYSGVGTRNYKQETAETFFVHITGARFTVSFVLDLGLEFDKEKLISFLNRGILNVNDEDCQSEPYNIKLFLYDYE